MAVSPPISSDSRIVLSLRIPLAPCSLVEWYNRLVGVEPVDLDLAPVAPETWNQETCSGPCCSSARERFLSHEWNQLIRIVLRPICSKASSDLHKNRIFTIGAVGGSFVTRSHDHENDVIKHDIGTCQDFSQIEVRKKFGLICDLLSVSVVQHQDLTEHQQIYVSLLTCNLLKRLWRSSISSFYLRLSTVGVLTVPNRKCAFGKSRYVSYTTKPREAATKPRLLRRVPDRNLLQLSPLRMRIATELQRVENQQILLCFKLGDFLTAL